MLVKANRTIEKLLDEQKMICQNQIKRELIDGVWYVSSEDVLNAPYPKRIALSDEKRGIPLVIQIQALSDMLEKKDQYISDLQDEIGRFKKDKYSNLYS